MQKRIGRPLFGITCLAIIVALVWGKDVRRASRALVESLRPTTVEMMPLSVNCVSTKEAPPAKLLRIVTDQEHFYHLTRQELIVCRSAVKLPQDESEFSEVTFASAVRARWL